jgi:hypothetical protein
MRVTNGIPLGCSLLLPVGTVNHVATRKGSSCATWFMLTVHCGVTTLKGSSCATWFMLTVHCDVTTLKGSSCATWVVTPELYPTEVRCFALDDAIGSHACSREALACV